MRLISYSANTTVGSKAVKNRMVAIPAVIFHRYLSGKVDRIVVQMEEQALKMVEVMHGEREQ